MLRIFLIDGYNLLHRIEEFAGSAKDSLEDRRERLLRRLVGLSAARKIRLRVVFDGARCHASRSHFHGLAVNFVPPPADSFIRGIIEKNERNRNLVVVSSDRKDIGSYARLHGLEWMTSEQFWEWLNEAGDRRRDRADEEREGSAPPGWSDRDDAALRRIFENE